MTLFGYFQWWRDPFPHIEYVNSYDYVVVNKINCHCLAPVFSLVARLLWVRVVIRCHSVPMYRV